MVIVTKIHQNQSNGSWDMLCWQKEEEEEEEEEERTRELSSEMTGTHPLLMFNLWPCTICNLTLFEIIHIFLPFTP